MDKKQLKVLPTPKLEVNPGAILRALPVQYVIRAALAHEGNLLILAFYHRLEPNGPPEYVVFQNQSEYLSRRLKSGKYQWSTASLDHLISDCKNKCIFYSTEDEELIRQFVPPNLQDEIGNPISYLIALQQYILKQKRDKRIRERWEAVDAQMKLIRPLPKGFDNWLINGPFKKSRYIFYHRSPKRPIAFCTHCLTDVALHEKPVHNRVGTCPHCGSTVLYKAVGRSAKLKDRAYITVLQSVKSGGSVLRFFRIYRGFQVYKSPETEIREYGRIFIHKDCLKDSYVMQNDPNTHTKRWCKTDFGFWFVDSCLYPKNLKQALRACGLEHSRIQERTKYEQKNVLGMIHSFRQYPIQEQLYKVGLFNLYDAIAESYKPFSAIDPDRLLPREANGKGLAGRLGVNRDVLKQMIRIDATPEQYKILRGKGRYSDEDLKWIKELGLSLYDVELLQEITSLKKLQNYFKKHKTEYMNESAIFREWRDYIQQCKRLKYDLQDSYHVFPKNLQERHDLVMDGRYRDQLRVATAAGKENMLRIKIIEEKRKRERQQRIERFLSDNPQFTKDEFTGAYVDYVMLHAEEAQKVGKQIEAQYDFYKGQFGFCKNELMIIPPRNADDFIRESLVLEHCIVSYAAKVARGESIILFIRRHQEPDKPFYSLEFKNDSVVQCQGKWHKEMTLEMREFVNDWLCEKVHNWNGLKAA